MFKIWREFGVTLVWFFFFLKEITCCLCLVSLIATQCSKKPKLVVPWSRKLSEVVELFKHVFLPQGKTCVLSDYSSIWVNQSLRSSVGTEKEHMLFLKTSHTYWWWLFIPCMYIFTYFSPKRKVDTMFKSPLDCYADCFWHLQLWC